jgi:chorismate-pyruvate lyase
MKNTLQQRSQIQQINAKRAILLDNIGSLTKQLEQDRQEYEQLSEQLQQLTGGNYA